MANRVSVEINANVQGFVNGMNQAEQSAQKYETEQRKIKDSLGNFNKELRSAKNEVKNLALAYSQLDAESKKSQFGIEMKKQLDAAKQAAADLVDMNSDLQTELKNLGSDTSTLDTITEGMDVFMQTTSAAMGIVAQFTGNEEDARKAVVMFTTAQSALNAMTKIQNALQMQSATMLGVTKIQTLAAAAATKIKTAAEGKNAVVTKAAAAAQALFNKIAMANPYVLLATAIVGVVTALTLFISSNSKAEKEEEELQKQIEETNKKIQEQREAYVNASASYMQTATKIDHLRSAYLSCNDEMKKTTILKEAGEEFKKLGISVNSVSDAQRILVNNGGEVVEMLRLQGQAAAISALQMEAYKKSMTMLLENGYDKKAASILAGSNKDYLEYEKLMLDLQTQINKHQKNLKIGNKTTSNHTAKVEVKVEDGSLQKLKDELAKLEEKKVKLKLSNEQLDNLNKQIDAKKKEIEKKEIELGIAPKPGSLEYINKQISEIDNKIKKLDPKIDFVLIEDLKVEKEALEKVKKDVEASINGVTITAKAFKSEGKEGSYQYAQDKVNYYKTKMELAVDDEDYQHWKDRYEEWRKKAEKMRIKIEADTSDAAKGSLKWLSDEKAKWQKQLDISVVGSRDFEEAREKIEELTKKEQKIQLDLEIKGMSNLQKAYKAIDGLYAIDDVVNSFDNLSNALEGDANAWEIFMAAISTVESVMAGINAVTEIANMLGIVSASVKAGEAAASAASTAATTTEAGAETAAQAPATALAAANKAAEKSFIDLASAMIFAAHASIPFAGVGIASGFITTMLSIQAAVKAATLSMMAFAEGGIVGGSSYHGDRILARVNSHEMILNDRQQRNLFNLLDSDVMPQKGGANVSVHGVIRGTDLILVQKNANKVRSNAGTEIKF